MWECVWWHSMWDGECEKTSDGCEHSEKWGERERGDEWVSVRRVVWVSSQGWRWVWEHSVWEHSCEWVVVGVMWEQAGMSEHGSTSDGSESVRWLGLVRWVWVCVRTLSMGWVATRVMWVSSQGWLGWDDSREKSGITMRWVRRQVMGVRTQGWRSEQGEEEHSRTFLHRSVIEHDHYSLRS